MSINRVNISGNLSRDPELRQTQGGSAILSFGVAVNDRRKNPQTGQYEDYPNWVDCAVFGNRATALAPRLSKGMKVAIEGKLRWSQWEHNGEKRSKLEVIVDEIEFLSGGGQQGAQRQTNAYRQSPQSAPQAQYSPQIPQGYAQYAPQQQAPQMAPQQPMQQMPAHQMVPQQPMPQQPMAPQGVYVEDSDIPF